LKILGISAFYHDSAVCLIEGDKILYAAQEERFSRIKNDANFPILALKDCLNYLNISLSEIETIVYYEKPFLKFERILNTYLGTAPLGLQSFIHAMKVWTKDKLFIKQNLFDALKSIDKQFDRKKITLLFSAHHLSHAASTFFPSPFEEAAILTIDGVGEYATTSLYYGNGNEITPLKEIHFPHSIGLLYSSITYFLDFKVNSDEYKIMGLAAYGNGESAETIKFIEIIENQLIRLGSNGNFELNMSYFSFQHSLTMVKTKKWEQLFGIKKREAFELTQTQCNLAYAFQKITQKAVLNLCHEIKAITKSNNLCLAGGVALNGVINGIIKDKKIFENIFITPASGDAGGALGAALVAAHLHFEHQRTIQLPDNLGNSLLGNAYSDEAIYEVVKHYPNIEKCHSNEELCKKTAEFIDAGKVIGWFQGRMEFGPRALGNRSILADPRNETMQLHLNMKIKNRESFRPFAPAILEEEAHKYFDMEGNSPYMLQVHKIKKEWLKPVPENYPQLDIREKLYLSKSAIPSVTHVDFSARIQTVNKKEHPLFWQLINTFFNLTRCPMLINTSFNTKDEPIVCSPIDAFNCFIKTGMDVLVVGNYILTK
jgi:carbamoyltransferase